MMVDEEFCRNIGLAIGGLIGKALKGLAFGAGVILAFIILCPLLGI